jgi:hypothetical protein
MKEANGLPEVTKGSMFRPKEPTGKEHAKSEGADWACGAAMTMVIVTSD